MAKSDFLALCHQVQMARRDANRGESDPESDPSRIGLDHVREAWVSTVWLGIDLGYWGWGPPIIFETMIFGGEHDSWCERYATKEAALAGHERVVAALKNGDEL